MAIAAPVRVLAWITEISVTHARDADTPLHVPNAKGLEPALTAYVVVYLPAPSALSATGPEKYPTSNIARPKRSRRRPLRPSDFCLLLL